MEAYKTYYQMKSKAHKMRGTYLDRKAAALAEEKELDKATVIKQLKHREEQRTSGRIIRHTLKKLKGGAVMKIEVNQNGQIVELTKRQEVEQACIDEHDAKFSQTNNTPPMQPPLSTLLGPLANTEFSDDILMGMATFPPELDAHTTALLTQLKKPDTVRLDEVVPFISAEEWSQGWKKMNETTSAAGLTGLHFGHLKACSTDEFLTNFESSLSQIAYSSGSVPSTWTNSVVCLIKKNHKLSTSVGYGQ